MVFTVVQKIPQTAMDMFHALAVFLGVAHKKRRNSLKRHLFQNITSTGLPNMGRGIDTDHGQNGGYRRQCHWWWQSWCVPRMPQSQPQYFLLAQIRAQPLQGGTQSHKDTPPADAADKIADEMGTRRTRNRQILSDQKPFIQSFAALDGSHWIAHEMGRRMAGYFCTTSDIQSKSIFKIVRGRNRVKIDQVCVRLRNGISIKYPKFINFGRRQPMYSPYRVRADRSDFEDSFVRMVFGLNTQMRD